MRTPKPMLREDECRILAEVALRLIEPGERERFDQLICHKHYLHRAALVREQLRYVAHERPKQLWARELRPGARTLVRGRNLPVALKALQEGPRIRLQSRLVTSMRNQRHFHHLQPCASLFFGLSS